MITIIYPCGCTACGAPGLPYYCPEHDHTPAPQPLSGNRHELIARLNSYLGNGGFFNPEHMDHEKVRDLILDVRNELVKADPPQPPLPRQYTMSQQRMLCQYLDTISITSDNIGDVRRSLLMPFDCEWNGLVRDETAERENTEAKADPPQDWQPIETAPTYPETPILLWTPHMMAVGTFDNDEWWILGGRGMVIEATHWMPLPKPPVVTDDQTE